MKSLRLILLFAGFTASLASILGPGEDIPPVDLCEGASVEGVGGLEMLGAGESDALQDQQVLTRVFGPQGGAMLPMRFQLAGTSVPICAAFTITLDRCLDLECQRTADNETETQTVSLATYSQGQVRVTRDYFLILPYQYVEGMFLRIEVAVGSESKQARFWIDRMGTFLDAGVGSSDGGVADANVPDAKSPDANVPDANPGDAGSDDASL